MYIYLIKLIINILKMQRNNNKSTKAFCKVSYDAGKSEKEYTSHFTRESSDKNAKVTCPTLLALECRYCHKNGHTIKYCTILKKNQSKPIEITKKEITKKESNNNTNTNRFGLLDMNEEVEESEEKEEKNVFESFPVFSLKSTKTYTLPATSLNFLEAIKKEAPAQEQQPIVKRLPVVQRMETTDKERNINKSWVAMDSDSEYDQQECWEEDDSHNWDYDGFDDDWEEEYERPLGKPAPWAKSQVAYYTNTW